MFGGAAMALVIVVTLVVAFFATRQRKVPHVTIPLVAKAIGRRRARPPLPPPAALVSSRAGEDALVHMVIDAQHDVQPQKPSEAPYELDVLNIRVPGPEHDGALGKRDAMSIVLTTQYFDMIKKMGASNSTSTP
jgi:hypothetical protein